MDMRRPTAVWAHLSPIELLGIIFKDELTMNGGASLWTCTSSPRIRVSVLPGSPCLDDWGSGEVLGQQVWVLQTVLILQDISAPMGPLHPQGILKGLRILSELLSRSFATKLRIGTWSACPGPVSAHLG